MPGPDEHDAHEHGDHRQDRDERLDPCGAAIEELYHFLHGELTEERRITIQVHLDGCSSCLEVFDFEAELREVVAERCQDRVPDDLKRRIAGLIGLEDA